MAMAIAIAAAAPAAAAPIHFAAKGDWGHATPEQTAVNEALCAAHDDRPFAFVLTTGDNFSRPDGVATTDNFTAPETCIADRGLGYVATWGNHDLGGDATATALGAAKREYSLRRGPVRLIVLDGNRPDSPAARARFIRALARRDAPVSVVAVHQPIVSAGIHRGGPERWQRIAESGGVTLVLQGHNHFYERVREGRVNYVTTGGGGAPLTPCFRPRPTQAVCRPRHHFSLLTADERAVRLAARGVDGADFDRAEFPVRGGPADPERLASWARW